MILYRTNWIVDKPSAKDSLSSLRLRVKWCKSKNILTFALPFKVDATKWVQSAQRLKPNTTHGKYKVSAADINKRMSDYEQYIADIFNRNDTTPPTKEAVRDAFDILTGKTAPNQNSLLTVIDKYVSAQMIESQWTEATIKKIATLRRHLAKCCKGMAITDIDMDTVRHIIQYFVNLGYRNSYTTKMFRFLKTFLRWAIANGYAENSVLDSYKPRLKGSEGNGHAIVYLTWDELQTLFDYPFEQDSLRQVRDVFCFCAFSGLRYSDVAKLRRADITDTAINVVTQKTTDPLTIELNDYTREILSRYPNQKPNELALPVICNQKYNYHLKEVGRIAGLDSLVKSVYYIGTERHEVNKPKWELLTTHCARRTFVVNALFLGIAPSTIMKWTGHSSYEAMKPYVEIVDELKKVEMAKFNRH